MQQQLLCCVRLDNTKLFDQDMGCLAMSDGYSMISII